MPASAYNLGRTKRHPLTKRNLEELGINIDPSIQAILGHPKLAYKDKNGKIHKPTGFSINKSSFGNFAGTAFGLGWITYMHLGEPLIEERCNNIAQPPPDTFSSRVYVNRDSKSKRSFKESVNFTVSNTVNWSLLGQSQLTFGGKVSASLQLQLQLALQLQLQNSLQGRNSTSMQNKNSNTNTSKNSKDSVGADVANTNETGATNTNEMGATTAMTNTIGFTTQGTATGTAELNAQLMHGITASVGGSLTTTSVSTSEVSGEIEANSRVETIATQRRTRKQYYYEIPVTFSGFFAVSYDEPVAVLSPPQPASTKLAIVVARDIDDIQLAGGGNFRLQGWAEVVSALDVHHTIFDSVILPYSDPTLYKGP
jgi:hypothetical protein